MRCFIALDLPLEAVTEIENIQNKLKKKVLFNGKFTERDNLHLTLKFFGEIDEGKIEEVKKRLQQVKFENFNVGLGEVGVFNKKVVRIIWIKLNGKGIFDLQKQIDEKLKSLFSVEERFMCHITIARVKSVGAKKELFEYLKSIKPKNMKFKIGSFSFKKSELLENGPIYENLEEYNFVKEKI
jgi:2'-5' RNA ligase